MARPDTTLSAISSQTGGWDSTVDENSTKLQQLLFQEPVPLSLFHRSVASEGSSPLADYDAADYAFCKGMIVDPASAATNGHEIYSNGTSWIYSRSGNTVT